MPREDTHHLLCSLFSDPAELRRDCSFWPTFAEHADSVDWQRPLAEVVFSVLSLVERRGLDVNEMFRRLEQFAPARANEIRRERKLFSASPTAVPRRGDSIAAVVVVTLLVGLVTKLMVDNQEPLEMADLATTKAHDDLFNPLTAPNVLVEGGKWNSSARVAGGSTQTSGRLETPDGEPPVQPRTRQKTTAPATKSKDLETSFPGCTVIIEPSHAVSLRTAVPREVWGEPPEPPVHAETAGPISDTKAQERKKQARSDANKKLKQLQSKLKQECSSLDWVPISGSPAHSKIKFDVTIDPSGHVKDVRFSGDDTKSRSMLTKCIQKEVVRAVFGRGGSAITVSARATF